MSRSTIQPPTVTLLPSPGVTAPAANEAQLVAALEEYMALREQGRAPERRAFLAKHAEVAEDLAACLDGLELVESGTRLGAVLESPHASRDDDAIAPATRLGDFRIVRVLGRGGMGVVYEAEQVSLGRTVALKVLPFAAAIDPKQRQRFQVEAQAAAHLHHPRIVPVFAVGYDGGVHYFAMQLIDGRTLAEIIRERSERPEKGKASGDSKLLGSPSTTGTAAGSGSWTSAPTAVDSPRLDDAQKGRGFPRAVARMALQVAEALDHAHTLGVIHRDIKPGNLMIDVRGDVWVTDFGLARMLGDVTLTITGDLLGTLRYMSPEQAMARRGVVDQRTDIYSLGVTLYELLTSRPAFDSRDRGELLRQIAQNEPTAPRRLDPTIPRDLETIVLKAMAKEPDSRYETARDLADDLRRFLEDQPIFARRPSPVERTVRWMRRHRPVVLTGLIVGLVGAVATAGLVGMSYQRFLDREKLAEVRLNRAKQVGQLYQLTDELSMIALVEIAKYDKLPKGPAFYAQALEQYEKIAQIATEDGEMGVVLAGAYRRIGFIQNILRHTLQDADYQDVDPIASYRRAVDLYEAALAKAPNDPKLRAAVAGTLSDLMSHEQMLGQWQDLARDAGRAIAFQRENVERSTGATQPGLSLSWALTLHAMALDQLGDRAGADVEIQEAERRWGTIAAGQSMECDMLREVESVGNHIGSTLFAYGREDEGRRILKEAARVNLADPSAEVLNNAAWNVVSRPGASSEEIHYAIARVERALALDPYAWHYLNTLGIAHLRAGRFEEAIETLQKSIQSGKGGDPHDYFPLAMAHWKLDRRDDARYWFDRGFVAMQMKSSPHPDIVSFHKEAREMLGIVGMTAQVLKPAQTPLPR